MSQQHVRMTNAIKDELRKPKSHWSDHPAILLARVSLGVIYMYLILMSYELMGISGPVFISILFLVSFFIPQAYRLLTQRPQKNAQREQQPTTVKQAGQEG